MALETLLSMPDTAQLNFEVTLQCNDPEPDILPTLDRIAASKPQKLTLVREALDPAAYAALLASADIVLTPYWSSTYEARTSGVFVEAACADKVIVCTRETWMEAEARRGAGAVVCQQRDAHALADAIMSACKDHSALANKAGDFGRRYRRFHNRDTLFGQLSPL